MSGEPFPKTKQLARGERRYRRKVASPKDWQRIIAAKGGPCRICGEPANGRMESRITFHHLVPRDYGGDDVADNLVPVCLGCHEKLEQRGEVWVGQGRRAPTRKIPIAVELVVSLTDAEYAYAVDKLGEAVWERVYGIEYTR